MAAHDYWRVSFLDSQGGGYPAASDIQFRPTVGVAVTPAGGVASISSALFGAAAYCFDGDPTTGAVLNAPTGWIAYHYAAGTGPDAKQLMLRAHQTYYVNEGPKNILVEVSDDGVAWSTNMAIDCGGAWASEEIRLFLLPTDATPEIEATEARTFSIFSQITEEVQSPETRVFSVYNFPSEAMEASQGRVIVPVKRDSTMQVSQVRSFAVIHGRIANPRVRAWTFTLDGHDFYVLRLGDETTLLYDTASEQWIEWTSKESGAWRPNTGMTWIGAAALGDTYNSNIVAGDDTFGLLWFLDPDLAWDENPDSARTPQEIDFDRIVSAQSLTNGRSYVPCYALFLDGDNYGLTADDFVPSIVLETSDDQGRTFFAHDVLTVVPDITVDNPYSWYSLGQISSPGRIFRVTDNGVFTRIDTMTMNDDGG